MEKRIELGPNMVQCQKWEETERGWGERPDGYSLHVSIAALQRYIQAYWDRIPDETPDEYSRPSGEAYPLGVSDATFEDVKNSGDGLRIYRNDFPGSGGVDGWMPRRPR